jgi:hypothetical protein
MGAIFAPVSREDPKPGRWILPLVVAGLIGFTYVFVNALPAAEVSNVSSPTASTSTTTSTTSTTVEPTSTTLDPEVAAFIEATTTLAANVGDLADLAQQINDDWDTRAEDFGTTRDALEDLEAQTITLADDTAAIETPPAIEEWDDVIAGLDDLRQAAADMIDGLVNAEGSDPRLEALENYKIAAADITNALRDVRDAAGDPAA